jgi:hypothetical protein
MTGIGVSLLAEAIPLYFASGAGGAVGVSLEALNNNQMYHSLKNKATIGIFYSGKFRKPGYRQIALNLPKCSMS